MLNSSQDDHTTLYTTVTVFVTYNYAQIIAGLHKVSRNLRSRLKILDASRVTRSEMHAEDTQMLVVAVQKFCLLHPSITECYDLLGVCYYIYHHILFLSQCG